jgi:protein-serine/threonine kinase
MPLKSYFSKELKSLIDELTAKKPSKRLGSVQRGGSGSVKSHVFFVNVNWDEVLAKKNRPPVKNMSEGYFLPPMC